MSNIFYITSRVYILSTIVSIMASVLCFKLGNDLAGLAFIITALYAISGFYAYYMLSSVQENLEKLYKEKNNGKAL